MSWLLWVIDHQMVHRKSQTEHELNEMTEVSFIHSMKVVWSCRPSFLLPWVWRRVSWPALKIHLSPADCVQVKPAPIHPNQPSHWLWPTFRWKHLGGFPRWRAVAQNYQPTHTRQKTQTHTQIKKKKSTKLWEWDSPRFSVCYPGLCI